MILGTGYQVYHWYDLNGLQYDWGGENIGWNNGYSDADSPVAIHQGFMDSPGHRANILEPSFTHGGVGAYAKDNVMFLGKQRSPRFYTELFMDAASAAPPPPSGGGGGRRRGSAPPPSGGGGTSRPARRVSSTGPPDAKPLHVDAPAAPRASSPMDGATLVAAGPGSTSTAGVRALALAGGGRPGWQPGCQSCRWPPGRVGDRPRTRAVRDRAGLAAGLRPLAGARRDGRIGPNPSV